MNEKTESDVIDYLVGRIFKPTGQDACPFASPSGGRMGSGWNGIYG